MLLLHRCLDNLGCSVDQEVLIATKKPGIARLFFVYINALNAVLIAANSSAGLVYSFALLLNRVSSGSR